MICGSLLTYRPHTWGYSSFCVQNLDTGVTVNVSKHELRKVNIQDVNIVSENWDEEVQEHVLDTPATISAASRDTATGATSITAAVSSSHHVVKQTGKT